MLYRLSADLILIFHFAFVIFLLVGGLLVLRWPRLMWLHLPTVVWGALIELTGFFCPLTPLEVALQKLGGEAGYEGGFVEHYITAILYPSGLTRKIQIALGFAILLFNAAIYCYLLLQQRQSRSRHRT